MSGILDATKDVGIFNELLQTDQDFAFNTLDCTSHTPTLFKILFNQLKQHEGEYIQNVKRKNNASAMSAILNATKDVQSELTNVTQAFKIFNELLKDDEDKGTDLAFNTLDRASHTPTLFNILFNQLKQYEDKYIKYVKRKNSASAMSAILNVIQDDDISIGIFNELLQTKKDFAFNTLDRTGTIPTLFKILFNQLKQYESEYIEYVKRKNSALAMSAILNATKDVESDILNVTQADKIFNELLQIDQDFAFNTLDDITPK
ncbi:MAG: S-adenosylmethionine decarboxylase proenzyme [Wolbachia endosymbiont of Ctenocephalides orientis wCori]|nr:MAG: S-adenosylmethionine decarboxylase proenzyme [Wolbachia endosymbiont of Ctenocephalides orientis wCori]